jgi:hypothetical protein
LDKKESVLSDLYRDIEIEEFEANEVNNSQPRA